MNTLRRYLRCIYRLYPIKSNCVANGFPIETDRYVLFQQVSHGAVQFTAYEELRKVTIDLKSRKIKENHGSDDKILVCILD